MGTLPCDCLLEEHTVKETVRTTHSKMTRLIPCLVPLVAAVAAQEAKETPLWFLETSISGSFRERSDACANQCCEFKPPLKNPPPEAAQPSWFETTSDCSAAGAVVNGPTLFRGKDLDPKKICFQLEDGSYELREGFLGNCGGPCCIFYGEAASR